ncbi:armadillo repeat-containing protein 3 [Holotrichia oblita]|uniref:Armadillo repeat-containing protein 3 n=2 Tax=Holotrichia oblita TaxID=644536 RepID=A0ACB9STD0_HOLOL|nr:armadillo repeat-containing protein 3 [Holotrichia oblita]KAI4458485.1 armadillo repeat-containing protein 3 [Holotrichia oblita]
MNKNSNKLKSQGNNTTNNREVIAETKSFNTEDIKTSIALLSTKEYNVLLKAVGTLCRYGSKQEDFLERYIENGIYPKFINLLENKSGDILKYALKLMAMLAKRQYLHAVDFQKIVICTELVNRIYIENNDNFIKECCSFILWQYIKHNQLIASQIYSTQLIDVIFDDVRRSQDVDILFNCLNLYRLLLDTQLARGDTLINGLFSFKVVKCLLECDQDELKDITMNIVLTLTSWRSEEMNLLLTNNRVIQIMFNILLKNERNYIDRAYNIIQNCLSHEKCALIFSKSTEFQEFVNWLKTCSNKSILRVLPILEILSKIPEIRDTLYALGFEKIIFSWMRYKHPDVIEYVLKIFNNLTEHKRFCQEFCKYGVITTIGSYIIDESLPQIPHCQDAVSALKNLLIRQPNSLRLFVSFGGISLIKDLFIGDEGRLSEKGYKHVITILHLVLSSDYVEHLLLGPVFEKIFELYTQDPQLQLTMLDLINILGKHEEFRYFVLEKDRMKEMITMLKKERTSYGTQYHLEVLSNLVKYKYIGYKLLDLEFLQFIKSIKPKLNLPIIQNIINDMHDYCLTLKFFETNRLDIHNKLDDQFYLIQDRLSEEAVANCNFNSSSKPVYVVSVRLLKLISEIDNNQTGISSAHVIEDDAKGRRFLSTSSAVSDYNLNLKAVYQHSQIPKNILYDRCVSFFTKDDLFYKDYYLEHYILTLMRDLYFAGDAPKNLTEKIEVVAQYVAQKLSGIFFNLKEEEKPRVFEEHIRCLRQSMGMNVIPIGYLRMGNHCERALLFKVLCDNLCIPTTLCRDKDIYWNEVVHTNCDGKSSYRDNKAGVYIVDLMKHVGKLMPVHSLEAYDYLTPTIK